MQLRKLWATIKDFLHPRVVTGWARAGGAQKLREEFTAQQQRERDREAAEFWENVRQWQEQQERERREREREERQRREREEREEERREGGGEKKGG
jgi:hypothetical protein